ncbi:MAG: hypothetical protein M3P84_05190 [Chloroflexota bacterium]|nr:hypothetical protein [Chloroflexota bacterium]
MSKIQFGRALALGAILAALSVSVAFAANGNNGTVKVHDGATDNGRTLSEDSHVCTFHLHFFFADAGQEGVWQIDQASPTGDAPSVLSGSYATGPNGEAQTVEYGLPIGHYNLVWQGRSDQNNKHKSFWVTCENPPGPIGGGGGIG